MIGAAKTLYAPAERTSETDLLFQIKLVAEVPIIKDLFDSLPIFVAILNENREIVFANKKFTEFFKSRNLLSYLGKRQGEAIGCLHSTECTGGCGTSEACSVCGAVNAILMSQKNGSSSMECRITLDNLDPIDLSILAHQYKIGNGYFTIFAASDISDSKRRIALERIFFHDLLNTTGALKGFLDMLKDAPETEKDEYIQYSRNITEHLIEEIMSQKDLTLAEDNELHLNLTSFSTLDILKEIVMLYDKHIISLGKKIIVSPGTDDVIVINDKTILRRILGNLSKNALEAIDEGDTVTLGCKSGNGRVEFFVRNNKVMQRNVQLQIFQRSFSTKGKGRGLGTYSVRLLTERYLKGNVRFISDEENQTIFYLDFPLTIEV